MSNIAAIVVTFNREIQLIDCLEAIKRQTLAPTSLFIIDNHSKQETYQYLLKYGFINSLPDEKRAENQVLTSTIESTGDHAKKIKVYYVRKAENDGGAGGFYEGMRQGFESGADWLWMMDDDGLPEDTQLQLILKGTIENDLDYTNALVVDIDEPTELAFSLGSFRSAKEAASLEVIKNLSNPFNGTLISRNVVEKIGYIKREMFIWGDETEYTNRVKKNGFKIATITAAIHRHPSMRGKFETAIPLIKQSNIVVKPLKFAHIYYRNLGYNQANYASKKASSVLYLLYHIYFLRNLKFKELRIFRTYFTDGLKDNFTRK
jgi:GT2 family glycosyltransferase